MFMCVCVSIYIEEYIRTHLPHTRILECSSLTQSGCNIIFPFTQYNVNAILYCVVWAIITSNESLYIFSINATFFSNLFILCLIESMEAEATDTEGLVHVHNALCTRQRLEGNASELIVMTFKTFVSSQNFLHKSLSFI